MDYLHIIAIYVFLVFVLALYFIAKVLTKEEKIGNDTDFITGFINKKEKQILKNDINIKVSTYLILLFIFPLLIGIIVFLLSKNAILTVIFTLSGMLVPDAIITFLKNKQNKEFDEKYEKSLEQLSSCLKAGMSIMQSIKEVSENKFIAENIRKRYAKLYADLTMGITIKDAFREFAESTNSEDAKDVALVIDVSEDVGGHEADAIMIIVKSIHDRLMLKKEVRSMFAATTFLIYLMDCLPLIIISWLCLTSPLYKEFYFNGIHIIYALIIVTSCLTGSIINHRKIKKIIKEI